MLIERVRVPVDDVDGEEKRSCSRNANFLIRSSKDGRKDGSTTVVELAYPNDVDERVISLIHCLLLLLLLTTWGFLLFNVLTIDI